MGHMGYLAASNHEFAFGQMVSVSLHSQRCIKTAMSGFPHQEVPVEEQGYPAQPRLSVGPLFDGDLPLTTRNQMNK